MFDSHAAACVQITGGVGAGNVQNGIGATVPGLVHGNQGAVAATGWDFGEVALSGTTSNQYILPVLLGSSQFSAVLSWYADNNVNFGTLSSAYGHFLDLNLGLYTNNKGSLGTLVADSFSL